VATSQNGWPASSDRRAIGVAVFEVHEVAFPGGVKAGDVAVVLEYVVNRFRLEVEPLVPGWCWGWNYRPVTGGGRLSNHASGTAVDVNAPHHPYGKRDTFTARQRDTIRSILAAVDNVVRWGGDYSRTPDDMHFEINDGPAAVARVAAKVRAITRPIQPPPEVDVANVELAHGDSTQRTPNGKHTWGDMAYVIEYGPQYPGGAGRRYMADTPAFRRMVKLLGPAVQWKQADLDAVHTVPGGEIPPEVYQ
jgi:hypothetical protein